MGFFCTADHPNVPALSLALALAAARRWEQTCVAFEVLLSLWRAVEARWECSMKQREEAGRPLLHAACCMLFLPDQLHPSRTHSALGWMKLGNVLRMSKPKGQFFINNFSKNQSSQLDSPHIQTSPLESGAITELEVLEIGCLELK